MAEDQLVRLGCCDLKRTKNRPTKNPKERLNLEKCENENNVFFCFTSNISAFSFYLLFPRYGVYFRFHPHTLVDVKLKRMITMNNAIVAGFVWIRTKRYVVWTKQIVHQLVDHEEKI